MIKCSSAVDLLMDFLEGNVSPEVRDGLMRHLHGCQPCVRFVDSYKNTSSLCRETLRQEVPQEMGDRLMDFLKQQAQLSHKHK